MRTTSEASTPILPSMKLPVSSTSTLMSWSKEGTSHQQPNQPTTITATTRIPPITRETVPNSTGYPSILITSQLAIPQPASNQPVSNQPASNQPSPPQHMGANQESTGRASTGSNRSTTSPAGSTTTEELNITTTSSGESTGQPSPPITRQTAGKREHAQATNGQSQPMIRVTYSDKPTLGEIEDGPRVDKVYSLGTAAQSTIDNSSSHSPRSSPSSELRLRKLPRGTTITEVLSSPSLPPQEDSQPKRLRTEKCTKVRKVPGTSITLKCNHVRSTRCPPLQARTQEEEEEG